MSMIYTMNTTKLWWQKLKMSQIHGEIGHIHGLDRLNTVEMTTLLKLSYRFSAIPIKILSLFENGDKLILKFTRKGKGPRRAKTILPEKNKVEDLHYLNQTYYEATVVKRVWYWCQDRHTDKWNRTESRNRHTHIWPTETNKGIKIIQTWRSGWKLYGNTLY